MDLSTAPFHHSSVRTVKINTSTSHTTFHPDLTTFKTSNVVNLCFLEALPDTLQHEIVTAIIDSGAGLSTISEELARRKGLILSPSNSMARLGDGSLIRSTGSTDVMFHFSNSDVLSEECKLSLESMGYNNSVLISRQMLSTYGFRFFDSHQSDFGSWLITPQWRWFKLRIEGGATVCDFQLSVSQGNLQLKPITDLPELHVNLSDALHDLVPSSTLTSTSDGSVPQGAVTQLLAESADTPLSIPITVSNNSVSQDAVIQPIVTSVLNPSTTPTTLSNNSVSQDAVTQPIVGSINNSLPTTTSVSDDAVPPGAATNLHDTVGLHGAAAQLYIDSVHTIYQQFTPASDSVFYTCALAPCCLTTGNSVLNNASAVAHKFKHYTRQDLHEIFGHVSDAHIDLLLHQGADTLPKLTRRQQKKSCRCPSCLRGFHPSRRVPRHSKRLSSGKEYLTGESWNFDFGRYWSDGDIEGFRTDATFV